jgi:CDP-glycerol glycerophosphotransferase (TagB/SpsB family)
MKILISLHTMPTIRSYKQIILNELIPILKKNIEVKIFWFIYMPEKNNQITSNNIDEVILDIHDFKNAVDVIQKIKPDIIYSSPTNNLPDYALNLAAKYLKIPTIGEIMNDSITDIKSKEILKYLVKGFLSNSVPTDTTTDTTEKKQFLRRGRFFIFKYRFLLRTQKVIGISSIKRIKDCFTLVKDTYFEPIRGYNPRFSCTHHFVESELIMKQLIKNGFNKMSLTITGMPVHDPLFRIINKNMNTVKRSSKEKIEILFLTHSLLEHGFQTKEEREYIIKGIINEFTKISDKYNLIVKIHPSSENILDYESIIKPINPEIKIIQKGDIFEYIKNADVVITYSTSTAPKHAILFKKPVIICNFFELKNDPLLLNHLAYDCKKLKELIPIIKKSQNLELLTEEKINNFTNEYFYKLDGKSAERMCNEILKIFNQIKLKKDRTKQ